MSTEKQIRAVFEWHEKANSAHYAFARHLLLFSLPFLGLVLSFGVPPAGCRTLVILFLTSIQPTILACLLLSIFLYRHPLVASRMAKKCREELYKSVKEGKPMPTISYNPPEWYDMLPPIAYVLFAIAVASILAYCFVAVMGVC